MQVFISVTSASQVTAKMDLSQPPLSTMVILYALHLIIDSQEEKKIHQNRSKGQTHHLHWPWNRKSEN